MKIEKSMLKWLIPEYDVYCVYQKYPGILYEYPALRFAQWLSEMNNISFVLYVHTKGAYNIAAFQEIVRELWKREFTKYNKKKYIELLKNNFCDIALPFRFKYSTWFNGMFISQRAFNLINQIEYDPKNRWNYEFLFIRSKKINNPIRIKGVICDNITADNLIKLLDNNKKFERNIEKLIIILYIFPFSLLFYLFKKE